LTFRKEHPIVIFVPLLHGRPILRTNRPDKLTIAPQLPPVTPASLWRVLGKLHSLRQPIAPLHWFPYVDDIFVVWAHGPDKLNCILVVRPVCYGN
jgi:hypothetical protein